MFKLLTAYRANPTLANAQKIQLYVRKHPMACVLLTPEDAAFLSNVIHHATKG